MGIPGLMTFVKANNQFFDQLKLRDSKLIIDGSNLYYWLYFDSKLDLQHGGDYDAFTAFVHKFFNALSACSISPYVVLDGGCDPTDKKLATHKQRAKDKIRMAQSLSKGRGGSVLPLLIREVFMQVLHSMQVPFIQCFLEADREIVSLANQWNCPVLTYDSDFCIFDLNGGYCLTSDFQWRHLGTIKGTKQSYIHAKCYFVEKLCSHFNHMDRALLPLFAVLNGNDYIPAPALEAFFRNVKFPIGGSSLLSNKHIRMQGLLNWLSGFTDPAEAMESILIHFKKHKQNDIKELLSTYMQDYQPADVKLEDFFQNGLYVCDLALSLKLPDWFLEGHAKGQISSFLGDVLVLKRIFLFVQVENMQMASAHNISKPIRQTIYRLLLNSSSGAAQVSATNKQTHVLCMNEFDRAEQTLKRTAVKVATEDCGVFQNNFFVSKITEETSSEYLELLLEALEVKSSILDPLPSHLMFPVAITCYWVNHCEPKVRLHHLYALLMGMVFGEMQRIVSSQGLAEKTKAVFDQFLKLKEEKGRNKSLDLDAAHIYCQWQSCLQMGLYLNQLLRFPLPEPDLTRLYSGTLVHRLCYEFKSTPATKDLLSRCPAMEELYQNLLLAVTSVVPPDFFQNKSNSKPKKSRKKK
ncbi:single-strand DNA endonuclease ASTE1 [Lissotriton helveticus]